MKDVKKKEIPFERVLFFSDAIVAIAITLLALNLKLELPENHHLTFQDLQLPWKNYLAFLLSFINIANFWRIHHQMYTHIHRMNERAMSYNIFWLFFIVTLPFSTTILSTHFGDSAAIFLLVPTYLRCLFFKILFGTAQTSPIISSTPKI